MRTTLILSDLMGRCEPVQRRRNRKVNLLSGRQRKFFQRLRNFNIELGVAAMANMHTVDRISSKDKRQPARQQHRKDANVREQKERTITCDMNRRRVAQDAMTRLGLKRK